MDLLLENIEDSMPVILHPPPMTDDEYYDFCQRYDGFRVERMSDGSVVIMPPTGWESGFQNSALSAQLYHWAKQDGRGKAFNSSAEYLLPDGSALLPDASWVSQKKIDQVPATRRKKFPRVCPEFVVELMSPSDCLNTAKAKMQQWMRNGVELGGLIDPERRQVLIYHANSEPETLELPDQVVGEGPVAGFVLDLKDIWAGL
jgi:Uma2 family endonuclease